MSKKRGRLKPEDEYKLTVNYEFLLENFDPTDKTLDSLFSRKVFDYHDKDKVLNGGENTMKGRLNRFLDVLFMSGTEAYGVFLECLNENDEEHVADQLESTDISAVNTAGPFGWIDELLQERKQQPLKQIEASKLSAAFGNGWEQVFSELGLSTAKVQQTTMTYSSSPAVAISALLSHWQQKNGSKVNWGTLLEALKSASDRCQIDWETVQKVAQGKKS